MSDCHIRLGFLWAVTLEELMYSSVEDIQPALIALRITGPIALRSWVLTLLGMYRQTSSTMNFLLTRAA